MPACDFGVNVCKFGSLDHVYIHVNSKCFDYITIIM